MTVTVTDLFCGAGGSSLGAEYAGAQLVMAANHWQTAIDVHQAHFPNAGHDCADVSQADPRRYPVTDILIASPECTNHSQARGVSRKRQDQSLWDAPDPSAERSRATMWDVIRFAEQIRYAAIVVENVIEATKWVLWGPWWQAMESLGYRGQVLSINSMHHGVPQTRDRIYVLWLRSGINVDAEFEQSAWCARCDLTVVSRQGWKRNRRVGRYGQQWRWLCTTCGRAVEPPAEPAERIIDFSLPCPRFGSKNRAVATRSRVLAGLQKHGWAPIITSGAGNVHERTPGNRARSIFEPLATQQASATSALATPPGMLFNTAHGGRARPLDQPHPTVCGSDDRLSLIVPLRRNAHARALDLPVPTVEAGGNHHGLIVTGYGNGERGDPARRVRSTTDPMPTQTTTSTPGLLMRNNTGGAEMVTSLEEPARTMTTAGHQSLLVPYNGNGVAHPTTEPMRTQPARDRFALFTQADLDALVDDCGFRMLEPYEVAAAMAFPVGYIPRDLAKKVQVRLAGNAVTPPVMAAILDRVLVGLAA